MQTIIILKVVVTHDARTAEDLDDSCAHLLGDLRHQYVGVEDVEVSTILINSPSRLTP